MDQLQRTSKSDRKASRQEPNKRKMVNSLSVVVVVCVLAILFFVFVDLQDPGHTINFDSMGGSDVAPQVQMYGELLALPEPPAREGYAFTGWYKDHACYEPWNTEMDTIQSEMTLYAGWEKID